MTKLLLIVAFVLTLSTLGFAAANAGTPNAPDQIVVHGQTLDLSLD